MANGIVKLVMAYRNTPHFTTGEKPTKLLFNWEVGTKLPDYTCKSTGKCHKGANKKDKEEREKQKQHYNKKQNLRKETKST